MTTNDKRRFVRMALENLPTVITRSDGSRLEVICKNLSGMGMLIESETPLKLNETIKALITTEKNELSVTATVTREQETADGEPNLYGLMINDIH